MSSRRYGQLALACVIVSAIVCVAPSSAEQAVPPAPAAPAAKDPAKLIKSLEDLLKGYQEENAALRAQVAELEAQVVRLQRKAVMVPQPGVPGQSQVPPGWQPFQFNGMTYYVVPLGDGQGAPARTITVPAAPAQPK
jgi:hypothetical protein